MKKEQELFEIELITTQLWLLLVNYDLRQEEVNKNQITGLLHILFCPYVLKQQEMVTLIDHAFPDIDEKRAKYVEEFPETAEEVLDSHELVRLWIIIKRKHLSSFAEEKKVHLSE